MNYNKLLRMFENTPPKSICTFKQLLVEFEYLTSDLKCLLIPALLNENEDSGTRYDYNLFKSRFKEICKFVITFIGKQKALAADNSLSLKDVGFIKKLDKEIANTLEMFDQQLIANDGNCNVKIQNAFFAYAQLIVVLNIAIKEYNDSHSFQLPVLENVPAITNIQPPIVLKKYFKNWLNELNKL